MPSEARRLLQDDDQSYAEIRHAAELGDADAQYCLALILERVSDKKAAFELMQAAANQGHSHACYCLGNFYRSGTWVDVDYVKAVEWYTKAAEQGNSDGLERLGECYASGLGVPQDDDIAFQYYQLAAESGNPKGQCYLGIAYLEGRGCRQDTGLGFHWITRAVDSGYPTVFQILQMSGLGIIELTEGYQRARELVAEEDAWFDENFERIIEDCQSH
jgi:TPR repeat protein